MAYNPTVWEENDLLSADRMNKIEQGIAEASETPEGLLPAGGTAGQMLVKTSDEDFSVEWADALSGDSILTIEDYTITDPQDIPDIFGSNEYLGFVHLKNTTIDDVSFEDEMVLFEYDDSKTVSFLKGITVYSILNGVKYTFMWDPDPNWGNPHEFSEKEVSDVTWDLTMQDVEISIKMSSVYARIDNFFDIYGIDKANGESQDVVFRINNGNLSVTVPSSATVYDVIGSKYFKNYSPYYDKNTGKIYDYKNKTPELVTISVNGVNHEPNPTPVSFATSFNGRNGAVVPQSGDYTAEMVGACTINEVNEAIEQAIGTIETALQEV